MIFRYIKIFGVLTFCIIIAACSNIEYVPNGRLGEVDFLGIKDDPSQKHYGAFLIKSSEKSASGADQTVFLINKHESRYVAETVLFDNAGVENATFERSYLCFTANKKNSSINLELRFIY